MPTQITRAGIEIFVMPLVIDKAAVVTRLAVTILEDKLVCRAAHSAKIKTMTSGSSVLIIGDKLKESHDVKPISELVKALPIAKVPAHIIRLGQGTPLDMASLSVSRGF